MKKDELRDIKKELLDVYSKVENLIFKLNNLMGEEEIYESGDYILLFKESRYILFKRMVLEALGVVEHYELDKDVYEDKEEVFKKINEKYNLNNWIKKEE